MRNKLNPNRGGYKIPLTMKRTSAGRFLQSKDAFAEINTSEGWNCITATYYKHADTGDHSNMVLEILNEKGID